MRLILSPRGGVPPTILDLGCASAMTGGPPGTIIEQVLNMALPGIATDD